MIDRKQPTVLERGEQQLKELYPPKSLSIDIKFILKKELLAANFIDPEVIINSTRKSSSKRNNLESSSCDFKKKKQDNNTETDSNGL